MSASVVSKCSEDIVVAEVKSDVESGPPNVEKDELVALVPTSLY